MIKSNLFLIPGWGEEISAPNYKNLIECVWGRYNVMPLQGSSMNKKYVFGENLLFRDFVKQAEKTIGTPNANDIILGFSVGGLLAYHLATVFRFNKAVVCSLSPMFGNDLAIAKKLYPEEPSTLTEAQEKELTGLSYKKPKSPTFLFCGSKEPEYLINRSSELSDKYNIPLVKIPDAQHELTGKYLETVKEFLV